VWDLVEPRCQVSRGPDLRAFAACQLDAWTRRPAATALEWTRRWKGVKPRIDARIQDQRAGCIAISRNIYRQRNAVSVELACHLGCSMLTRELRGV
jgi:hypothetical protein